MTQLQITPSQFFSSLFFSELAQLKHLRFSISSGSVLCTNLGLSEVETLECECEASSWQQANSTVGRDLVVYAQTLNLEKLWQVQQKLAARFCEWQIKSIDGVGISATAHIESPDPEKLKAELEALSQALFLELTLLDKRPILTQPGLLLMDMDSTVIDIECIDEIAKLAGVGEQVSEVTELAMQGKLDFAESLNSRVACLAGLEESLLAKVRDALPLMPGIETLLTTLRANGWKLAIASGGFTYFADHLKLRLGLDEAVSNQLQIHNGQLTGKVEGQIIDAQMKAETLTRLAREYNIPVEQTIALGDGANDLVMMQAAGLGVAYHAKTVVREQAQASIRFNGLDTLLHYLQ